MTPRDRTFLGSLVLAMVLGVGGSLALAASCLGRDRAQRAEEPYASFPEDRSARSSSGGVPGEEADEVVGSTRVTAAELPPAGAAAATTNAPPADDNAETPPPPPSPATQPELPAPHTHSIETSPAPTAGAAETTAADAGAADARARANGAADAGNGDAGPRAGADGGTAAAAPRPTATVGAGDFITTPPPFGASSWEPNHEAGAGPFTTERNVPDLPGP